MLVTRLFLGYWKCSFIYLFYCKKSIISFGLLYPCMLAFALLRDLAWIVYGQRVQSPPALEMRSFIFYLNNGLRTQRPLAQQGAASTNQLARKAIFNCLTFLSPHQSFSILCLEAKKQRVGEGGGREGERKGEAEKRSGGETVVYGRGQACWQSHLQTEESRHSSGQAQRAQLGVNVGTQWGRVKNSTCFCWTCHSPVHSCKESLGTIWMLFVLF